MLLTDSQRDIEAIQPTMNEDTTCGVRRNNKTETLLGEIDIANQIKYIEEYGSFNYICSLYSYKCVILAVSVIACPNVRNDE